MNEVSKVAVSTSLSLLSSTEPILRYRGVCFFNHMVMERGKRVELIEEHKATSLASLFLKNKVKMEFYQSHL